MKANLPAIGPLDDNSNARPVIYQGGQLVHLPLSGLGLGRELFADHFIRAVEPKLETYTGFAFLFHKPDSDRLVFVTRQALGHGTANATRLMCGWTDDGGASVNDFREIFSQTDADTRNGASGVMGSGRLAIVLKREDASTSTYLDGLFLYSDDDGDTWSTDDITFTTDTFDSMGDIYPWVAGGDNGFIFYTYTTDHGICAYTTDDNGATWDEHLDLLLPTSLDPDSEAASLSEMHKVRIGSQSKWVMVVRTNQEAAVSVSDDQLTWSSPKLIPDTTIEKMLANPPNLRYDADTGKIQLITFSRRGSKEIYPEEANALVVAEGDAKLIYSSGGVRGWKPWRVITKLPFWPTGYISFQEMRGRLYGLFTANEDTAGGSTSRTAFLYLLTPDKPTTADPRALMRQIPKPNLIGSGGFQHWPLGTSFTTGATRISVLPGFTVCRGDASAGATITRVAGNKAQYALRSQRSNGDTSVSPIYLNSSLTGADSYQLRERFLTVSFRARCGSSFTAASSFLFVRARSTASAESQVTNANGTFTTGDTTVTANDTGVTLTTTWQEYSLLLGPFAADILQARVEFYWVPVGTAAGNDWFEMEMLKPEAGKEATPFEWKPLHEVKSWCDRFAQGFTIRAPIGSFWYPFSTTMHRTPATAEVVCSTGTVSQVKDSGFILTVAGADVTVTVTVTANL